MNDARNSTCFRALILGVFSFTTAYYVSKAFKAVTSASIDDLLY